jgi:2-succinyl-6-hydroxy-2,4-cyclohexadiene-1-carboxylate synthase
VVITCVHGFLGLPRDWDFLRDAGFEIETPPLDAIPDRGDVLLGYSMGGRLALRKLNGYRCAVIVSARVSAPEPDRVDWSPRFAAEDWTTLMRDWNAQPIFGGQVMPREERDFDRRELVRQLRDFAPVAFDGPIEVPTLFVAGERDPKYVAEAGLAVGRWPLAEMWICPGAAHRVPWEQPELFIDRLREFVRPLADPRRSPRPRP